MNEQICIQFFLEMISSNDDFEYYTIFGVNEGNLESIKKQFDDCKPIYAGANYSDEIIWNRSLEYYINKDKSPKESNTSEKKNENNNNNSIQGEFHPTKIHVFDKNDENNIGEAFLNSTGNWIYAKFSKGCLKNKVIKSKYVLDNDDIIYCMRGLYQGNRVSSKIEDEEKNVQKFHSTDSEIYMLPKVENLVDLSFEGQPFKIKFDEFIFGNYKISIDDERKINSKDQDSGKYILIVSLMVFFIIFIYKIAK